jgi:SAM-dependent methyltransferase
MAAAAPMASGLSERLIRTIARPDCTICGAPGIPLYKDLTDRFFATPGRWNFSRCSQPRCAMLWLNPSPLEDDIWKAYLNYFTHDDANADMIPRGLIRRARQSIKDAYIAAWLRYSDHEIKWRERALGILAYLDPNRRADTDFPLKFLAYESRGRILDLGCGSGDLLHKMHALGWEPEGIDVDPAAVEVARRKDLRVRAGSLHEQRFPDACFDAVVMSHVIEHVHRPLELLSEVHRILKAGRRLVIATPNAGSLGHRMLRARWPFLDPPRHLQIFTAHALKSLVHAAGFDDVRVGTGVRTAAAMFPLIDASRTCGRLFSYGESLALHFDRSAGEEIALVATK